MKRSDSIVILGDLHAGSHCAPWPLDWMPAQPAHTGSRYVAECLAHFIASLKPFDTLILNGDLIDGPQRKSGGLGLFSPRLRDQVDGAMHLLEPLAKKAKRVLRVAGTPYHDDDHDPLFALDERFHVERVAQVFDLQLDGGILNVAHHPSFGFEHKGGGMSKAALYSARNAIRRKAPLARWIVRSHKHFSAVLEEPDITVAHVGCWQLPTPWAVKVNYDRFVADIGALLMIRDPEHPGGWRFRQALYDSPMPEVVAL